MKKRVSVTVGDVRSACEDPGTLEKFADYRAGSELHGIVLSGNSRTECVCKYPPPPLSLLRCHQLTPTRPSCRSWVVNLDILGCEAPNTV